MVMNEVNCYFEAFMAISLLNLLSRRVFVWQRKLLPSLRAAVPCGRHLVEWRLRGNACPVKRGTQSGREKRERLVDSESSGNRNFYPCDLKPIDRAVERTILPRRDSLRRVRADAIF